jgi:HSP20 family molecular chaperone IbpA
MSSQANAVSTTDMQKSNGNVLDYSPPVDIYENEHELLLIADTPGTTKEQVSIDVEQDQLKLTAAATTPDGVNVEYRRLFRVGVAVDTQAISATLKNGVLTIRLPKAEAYRPRKIEVRAA